MRFLLICALVGVSYAVDSLRFMTLGDWGGLPMYPYDTPIETSVAKQMASVARTYDPSFILALGDNFYFYGVTDVNDKRFKETYEDVYHYSELQKPWYLIAGNHDHYGNVSAQIAYTNVSSRWNFPNYYYTLHYQIPGGKTMDIVMLDTILLVGNVKGDNNTDQPTGPDSVQVAEEQWAWLEDQLNTSTANYLLVAGHFPVYSIAEHGPTDLLVTRLDPLLYKYNVTAYLCGHDHNMQHLQTQKPGKTMDYFVIGAANFCQDSKAHQGDVPPGSSKFFWAELKNLGGFSHMEVTSGNMTVTYVSGVRRQIFQHVVFPRF